MKAQTSASPRDGSIDISQGQERSFMKKAFKRNLREVYRSKVALISIIILVLTIVMALFAPMIAPHDPSIPNLGLRYLTPAWTERGTIEYPLGTDSLGRCYLSRIIFGARMSMLISVAAVLVGGTIGIILGMLSGYFGGVVDSIIMRIADLQFAFPSLLIGLIIMSLLGTGIAELILVIALTQWCYYARVVRSEVMRVKEMDYVHAAKVSGAGNMRIMRKFVLPNAFSSFLVVASFSLAQAIFYESAMSFFGLGIPPAIPTWGNILSGARNIMIINFWAPVFPGIAITLVVLAFNYIGDWMRDVLDVKL